MGGVIFVAQHQALVPDKDTMTIHDWYFMGFAEAETYRKARLLLRWEADNE